MERVCTFLLKPHHRRSSSTIHNPSLKIQILCHPQFPSITVNHSCIPCPVFRSSRPPSAKEYPSHRTIPMSKLGIATILHLLAILSSATLGLPHAPHLHSSAPSNPSSCRPPSPDEYSISLLQPSDPFTTSGLSSLKFSIVNKRLNKPVTPSDIVKVHERIAHIVIISENLDVLGHLHFEDFHDHSVAHEQREHEDGIYEAKFRFPFGGNYAIKVEVAVTDPNCSQIGNSGDHLHVERSSTAVPVGSNAKSSCTGCTAPVQTAHSHAHHNHRRHKRSVVEAQDEDIVVHVGNGQLYSRQKRRIIPPSFVHLRNSEPQSSSPVVKSQSLTFARSTSDSPHPSHGEFDTSVMISGIFRCVVSITNPTDFYLPQIHPQFSPSVTVKGLPFQNADSFPYPIDLSTTSIRLARRSAFAPPSEVSYSSETSGVPHSHLQKRHAGHSHGPPRLSPRPSPPSSSNEGLPPQPLSSSPFSLYSPTIHITRFRKNRCIPFVFHLSQFTFPENQFIPSARVASYLGAPVHILLVHASSFSSLNNENESQYDGITHVHGIPIADASVKSEHKLMVKRFLETGSDNFDPFISSSPPSHPNTKSTFNSHTSIHFQSQSPGQTSPNQFDVCSESASSHDHHHHGTGSEVPLMGPYFAAPLNFNKEGVWRIIAQMKVAGGVLVTAGWWVDVI